MEETKENRTPFFPPEAWQHARAAASELRQSVGSILPPEVGQHARAAEKEALLAVRSLIDAWVDRIERKQTTSPVPAGQ